MNVSPRLIARSMVALFCTTLSVALLGATTPDFIAPTTLVVFPFTQEPGLDQSAGVTFVQTLSDALTKLGGIKVVMADPATAQSDFLKVTKADNADYYLMGRIAPPLNNAVPVIEQLVSARSGTVVWSNTATIVANTDMVNQAPILKEALRTHAQRGFLALFNTPPPAPVRTAGPSKTPTAKKTPPPKKVTDGVQNLPNEAYGFSSKPTAPPKVYASAAHPTRFVVLRIAAPTGVKSDVTDYAQNSLVAALKRHGQTVSVGDPSDTQFPAVRGAIICQATGAAYLVFGNISGTSVGSNVDNNFETWTNAQFKPGVYDCAAQKFETPGKPIQSGAVAMTKAIDSAVDNAVSGYVLKVATTATKSS